MLQSLQVEALWLCCKIDLDQTVRDACEMILQGDDVFFPSHSYNTFPPRQDYDASHADGDAMSGNSLHGDGWVAASSGKTIYGDVARLRAAAAMAMIGDIMVHCSKEGTSWKK